MNRDFSLAGIFPPIPTPFEGDGIAHQHLAQNLERWNRTPLAGFVVLGSNGEYVYLTEQEKEAVIATARQHIPADKLLIAGTGAESTLAAIRLTMRAAEMGADAVLVVTPHYFKAQITTKALWEHYRAIADRSPRPVIVYDVPAFTGIDLTSEQILTLAQHPNIKGIKVSSPNIVKIGEVLRSCPLHFVVLAGSQSLLYPALCLGAIGGILALANIAPHACVQILRLFQSGQHEEARALHLRMLPLNRAVTAKYGVAGLKVALDLLGYFGGEPRLPLQPLTSEQKEEIKELLKDSGLLD
ncbi:MAG: dihydrodipicolinate synthase family protein [Chloroflexi bacterium]|nr:dihydrodipicolinate synthase family protein [Chloroflexota bacterium]MCL5075145.1 dihydrodipicolinate synthase family protein [Chloroflexota bacterium]